MKTMNKYGIVFLGLLFFTLQCGSPKATETNATKEISIKEQVSKGAFLVDVRSTSEFAEGSVKGAVNIPLDEVESRIGEFKNKPSVILFCRSGNRSSQAKTILENAGIQHIVNGINVDNMNEELGK